MNNAERAQRKRTAAVLAIPTKTLGPAAKLAYCELLDVATAAGLAEITAAELGARLGASDRAARKWVDGLVAVGLVDVEPSRLTGLLSLRIADPDAAALRLVAGDEPRPLLDLLEPELDELAADIEARGEQPGETPPVVALALASSLESLERLSNDENAVERVTRRISSSVADPDTSPSIYRRAAEAVVLHGLPSSRLDAILGRIASMRAGGSLVGGAGRYFLVCIRSACAEAGITVFEGPSE